MTTPIKESRFMIWILFPVFFSLLLAASMGLPLFQDGSSYLQEMLIDRSAVRHGRASILLFQYPTIFLIKTFHHWEFNPLITLPFVRLTFNLNYALAPFLALLLSWLVVRKKREELFIWAALIILFVNLVNFSWVSELLIAVQLSCPLLLALLQNPNSKTFWLLFVLLTPFVFFLHPLVLAIYLILAAASAYMAYRQPIRRSSAMLSAVLFLLLATLRGVYSFFTLSAYEISFAASGEIDDYFVISRLENILFLVVAVELAFLILLSQTIVRSGWRFMSAVPWLVVLQSSALLLLSARLLFHGASSPVVLLASLGTPAFVQFWLSRSSTTKERARSLFGSCALLAFSASILLMAQYTLDERQFTLKMGLDFFAVLLIMTMTVVDSTRDLPANEHIGRSRLVIVLSAIFAGVIAIKAVMWGAAVQQLEQTLRQTDASCTERVSSDFRWLEHSPYTMIDNWSLPTLALVLQDEYPRKLLLAEGDCQLFAETGLIQIDPWSRFAKELLIPPLE